MIQRDNAITTERLDVLLGISKRAILKQIDELKRIILKGNQK